MTPSIWFALGPVILFAIIGGIVGVLFSGFGPQRFLYAGWGIILGAMVGAWWFFREVVKGLFPEKYYAYGYDYGDTSAGPQVLAIDLTLAPNEHRWIECGLYPDEWRKICEAIHKTNKFTVAIFESVFGAEGRTNYAKLSAPLSDPDVGILIQTGNKGYSVTEGRGDYFFMRMATLPFPYPVQPDVLKMIGSTQRPQATHTEKE